MEIRWVLLCLTLFSFVGLDIKSINRGFVTHTVVSEERSAMAKVKIYRTGSLIKLWIKFSFGEKIDFNEYANIAIKGYYGLLKPESIKGCSLYYKTFLGKSLKEMLSNGLSCYDLIRIVEQILLVVMEVEEIGQSRTSIVMDLNYIYIDTECNVVRMICSSTAANNKNHTLSRLIYEILNAYITDDASNLNFRRRFLDYLGKFEDDDIYRIEDFLVGEKKRIVLEVREGYYACLYDKLAEKYHEIQRIDTIKRKISLEKEQISFETDDRPRDCMDDDEPTGFTEPDEDIATGFYEAEDDDEPTGFFDMDNCGAEETANVKGAITQEELTQEELKIVKNQSNQIREYLSIKAPRLIRESNGETIYINKKQFRLGREEGSVDYCIKDNGKISRAHADLILRGDQWFIVDLKAKNRTFLNNRVIQASVETPLNDGDVIKLNNEEFVFCLNIK